MVSVLYEVKNLVTKFRAMNKFEKKVFLQV